MAKNKNWFGITPHPTDEYINWYEKDKISKALVLRESYDRIKSCGLIKDLEYLLDIAYESGYQEAEDNQ